MGRLQWGTQDRSSTVLWYTFERFYRNQSPAFRVMYGGLVVGEFWRGRVAGCFGRIVEESLTDGGFEPAIASSGEEAVTLLKGGLTKYRALVTDINLSGTMSGSR